MTIDSVNILMGTEVEYLEKILMFELPESKIKFSHQRRNIMTIVKSHNFIKVKASAM